MKKIIVTGGSGKAGRAVVRDLVEHGYDVVNLDRAMPTEPLCPTLLADLTQFGEVAELLVGAWGVVHLAAIPNDTIHSRERTFRENTNSTFNIFEAAKLHGLQRVVWASSETTLGLPFDTVKPAEMPIGEDHYPFPASTYSLSKVVGETMAEQYARWTGVPHVGLRFSNVMEPADYARFASWQDDASLRKWNLWGYIDARDAGQSCRLALEAPVTGSRNYIIAAADTCMSRPNAELVAEVFPGTTLRPGTGPHDTLLSIDLARAELGFTPQYSWRTARA